MKVSKALRRQIQFQNLIFTLLFFTAIGLIGWLSTQYNLRSDWTANTRNTLSENSIKVLNLLDGKVSITAYARETKVLRHKISDFIGRYSHYKPDLNLQFVNPDTAPDTVQELGLTVDGELIIEFDGRRENIRHLSESTVTNALQRLASSRERWVIFLSGHGERSATDDKNHDLSQFGSELKRKGFKVQSINPAIISDIPDNTSLLVIADPQVDLLPGEIELIVNYIDKGGNFLWLKDPGTLKGLKPLAKQLGIGFLPGVVVEAKSQALGINNPAFAIVAQYPRHEITQNFDTLTLFPQASGLEASGSQSFTSTSLLRTSPQSWCETGPIKGHIEFNAGNHETEGPLDIGLALTRVLSNGSGSLTTQRVVIIGDADFLSNTYLGNAGNLNLGLNMIQWLTHNDDSINIPAKTTLDNSLQLSSMATAVIGLGFLVVLPLLLVVSGGLIWLKRRHR